MTWSLGRMDISVEYLHDSGRCSPWTCIGVLCQTFPPFAETSIAFLTSWLEHRLIYLSRARGFWASWYLADQKNLFPADFSFIRRRLGSKSAISLKFGQKYSDIIHVREGSSQRQQQMEEACNRICEECRREAIGRRLESTKKIRREQTSLVWLHIWYRNV